MDLKEKQIMDISPLYIYGASSGCIIYNIVRDCYAVVFEPTRPAKTRIYQIEYGFSLMHDVGDEEFVNNYLLSSVPDMDMIMRRIINGDSTPDDFIKLQKSSLLLPLYLYRTEHEGYCPVAIYENKYHYFNGMNYIEVCDESRIEVVAVGRFANPTYTLSLTGGEK